MIIATIAYKHSESDGTRLRINDDTAARKLSLRAICQIATSAVKKHPLTTTGTDVMSMNTKSYEIIILGGVRVKVNPPRQEYCNLGGGWPIYRDIEILA